MRYPRHHKPTAQIPRWLRPKLDASQVRDLGICHLQNLDAIAKGHGTKDLLHDWAESVLTWSHAADLIGAGVPEITEQLELVATVIERYRTTGLIVFKGPEYQLAKHGTDVMDAIAQQVDEHTAMKATSWAYARISTLVDSPMEHSA